MSCTREKGSAVIEMTFLFILFAIFLSFVTKFSVLSGRAHALSVNLQNDVEKLMIEKGRPVCIDKMDVKRVVGRLGKTSFGEHEVIKQLIFAGGAICE